jgi:hypothetical protein
MPVSSLVDFWDKEIDLYENKLLPAARLTAIAARSTLAQERLDAEKALADVAATQKQITDLRRALADEPTPADLVADATKLRALIAQLRNQNGVALGAGEALFAGQNGLERANAAVERLAAKVDALKATRAEAQTRKVAADAWAAALAAAPFATLKQDATDALAATIAEPGAPRGAALARLALDFPQELQDLAAERANLVRDELANFRTATSDTEALLAAHLATAKAADPVGAATFAFERAFAAVAAYVRTAKEDFDRAMSLYASVAATPALSKGEKDALAAVPASADLDKEHDRNAAFAAVDAAEHALESAVVALQKDDPTVAVTSPLAATLATKQQTLTDLQAAFATLGTPTPKSKLDAWEAALPDAGFQTLAALCTADQILARLAAIDATANTTGHLLFDLGAAADTLAAAAKNAAEAARTTEYLRDTLAFQSSRYTHAVEARSGVLLGRVRGDV